jgi:hypothetical protein
MKAPALVVIYQRGRANCAAEPAREQTASWGPYGRAALAGDDRKIAF